MILRKFATSSARKLAKMKIAVCQMTSTNDKERNLGIFDRLVAKAVQNDAKFAFFPEGTDYVAVNSTESIQLAETLDGPLMSHYKTTAKTNNIWLSIGGFHEKNQENKVKLNNSHVIIDNCGEIKSVYRKLHLFDVSIPEKHLHLEESKYVVKGPQIVQPLQTPAGNVGLAICYDLRFPELSVLLRKAGSHILTFPSAFTHGTGQAHWDTLLRARAIETQCYVIAAAQYGRHNDHRTSYGHSLVVDPWGKIVAECPVYKEGVEEDESVAFANVQLPLVEKIRKEMPVLEHRRDDVYALQEKMTDNVKKPEGEFKFADKIIPADTVFHLSKHCFAFTNIRCVVPGHVLVSSLRNAKRLQDLSPEEVADFFNLVVAVQKVVEQVHAADSSTICVQDGANAGQTVAQVHCHILPRKANDFARNDDVYEQLAKHDRDENHPIRAPEEMAKEAKHLKAFFNN